MGILDILFGMLFILIIAKIVTYATAWNKLMGYPPDTLKWYCVGPVKRRYRKIT